MFVYILLIVWRCLVFPLAWFFFFQAEDGIRDLVRSRGLGDVYKRQVHFQARISASIFWSRSGSSVFPTVVSRSRRTVFILSLIHI